MCRPTCITTRAWGGFVLVVALIAAPSGVRAQVFIATSPRSDIAVGPLFVAATAPADFSAPVQISVAWNVVSGDSRRPYADTLALLWPTEIAGPTTLGTADPALVNYVESRGFTSTGAGRLALRVRSQSQLGLPTPADDLPATASYVTFVRRDAPPQAGTGALVWIPPTAALGDARSVLNLTFPVRGMIGPKPATWLEDVFWGRRNALTLSWGDVGSIAFYPLYHEHRDRILPLAREYSRLIVSFPDAGHLRIESIEPPAAARRGSRLREATETVALPLNTVDAVPQSLNIQYAYYRGVYAWRPILISLGLLVLGNLAGLFMISGRLVTLVRARLRLSGRARSHESATLTPERLAQLRPGESTYGDVIRLFGPPSELRHRVGDNGRRTLVYRSTRRDPQRGLRVGPLATVRHWDIERYEADIELEGERVHDVSVRVRRLRASSPD